MSNRIRFLITTSCFLLPASRLHSQAVESLFKNQVHKLDSGSISNRGPNAVIVFKKEIIYPKASWIRIYFAKETRLAGQTQLRITSLKDGDVQFFQDWSIKEYEYASAHFNGGAVRIELFAASMTWANRVKIVSVDLGLPAFEINPNTICGPRDDRLPSTDPRVARQHPTGCTTWLISAYAGCTAGHCTSNSSQSMHFNVPASTSSGRKVLPPVSDQYPYVSSSVLRIAAGVGADWATFIVVRNSNTGLWPGEKQGSWFQLGTPPSTPATIRITGNGTSSIRVRTQVQQTHKGPLAILRSTSIGYVTDTTGGSSGSPVINEANGTAVGIHTHGGCSTSSSRPLNNWGTRIDRSDLQNAIKSILAQRNVGEVVKFGNGCKGSAGIPELGNRSLAVIGRPFELTASNLPSSSVFLLIFGSSDSQWNNFRLPIDLRALGMPGCSIFTSVDAMLSLPTGTGQIRIKIPVPLQGGLIGRVFFNQGMVIDRNANAAGFTMSNALRVRIGKD